MINNATNREKTLALVRSKGSAESSSSSRDICALKDQRSLNEVSRAVG